MNLEHAKLPEQHSEFSHKINKLKIDELFEAATS